MLPARSWYRCPELLLGARSYSTGVDVWAAGCIFAELMLRVPFMAAESDMDQLDVIFSALGTPTEQDWPVCCCSSLSQMSGKLVSSIDTHRDLPNWLRAPRLKRNPRTT